MEVVVFIGLQGSGKSTFYRARFASTHVLVSKDLFRSNRRPARRQAKLIGDALREGRSVVVDNTNPTAADRAAIVSIARAFGADVAGYYFDASVNDCVERNARRTGKERVPEAAIFITQKRMRPPTMDEGFDRLYVVSLSPDWEVVVRESIEEGAR
jgi:predicted kinase